MSTRGAIGGLTLAPPLDVETERALYPVIERGRKAQRRLEKKTLSAAERKTLLRERHAGQRAELQLLQSTCGLVRARVTERGYRFGVDELEAAGLEGLVNALQRFDSSKGFRFATYANYWINKMVNQAIQQQLGLSDHDMRQVLALQRLQRSAAPQKLTRREISSALQVSLARAGELLELSASLHHRRSAHDIESVAERTSPPRVDEPPEWVIEAVKRCCGKDFNAFWQHTFGSTSLEELAREVGISRQALSKRLAKCRDAVLRGPDAERLSQWFDRQ